MWEAEIYRMAGEVARLSPQPNVAAEAYFDRALAVARQQQAKSWELRAAMSMVRLWRDWRDEEIDLLMRRWEQAKRDEGSVVLVSGEPGIGKSRIAQTIAEQLVDEPHTRLRYFCSPHHQDSAFYPSIAQLERAAGFRRDDTDEQRPIGNQIRTYS